MLANECYDVIGDASPSVTEIALGTRVCVRHMDMFVEGVVFEILSHPVRFVVAVLGDQPCNITVKRADLRLLRPLWWDEFENNERLPVQELHVAPSQADFYTTAASPPPQHSTPMSACTPLSNGRQYDEFCDSEDELRTEMFPSEVDAKLSGSSKRSSMQSRGSSSSSITQR